MSYRGPIAIYTAQGELVQLIHIPHANPRPLAWSPDQQYLVYNFNEQGSSPPVSAFITKIGEPGSVWLNQVPDISPYEINGYIGQVHWSPTDDYIAYVLHHYNGTIEDDGKRHQHGYAEFVVRRIIR